MNDDLYAELTEKVEELQHLEERVWREAQAAGTEPVAAELWRTAARISRMAAEGKLALGCLIDVRKLDRTTT